MLILQIERVEVGAPAQYGLVGILVDDLVGALIDDLEHDRLCRAVVIGLMRDTDVVRGVLLVIAHAIAGVRSSHSLTWRQNGLNRAAHRLARRKNVRCRCWCSFWFVAVVGSLGC